MSENLKPVVVLLQAPVRFVVEHFRRDHEVFFQVAGYPLTESQIVALSMFTLAVPAMAYLSLKGQRLAELESSPASPEDASPQAVAGSEGEPGASRPSELPA